MEKITLDDLIQIYVMWEWGMSLYHIAFDLGIPPEIVKKVLTKDEKVRILISTGVNHEI